MSLEADLTALSRAILPEDIFGTAEEAASHIFDAMMQRFNYVITHRIELPENVTAKDYATKITHFLNTITHGDMPNIDRAPSDQFLEIHYEKLARYELDGEDCFYKLAKHNPEIALEYYISDLMIDIDNERLPISDNIELYALLIKACTHEELDQGEVDYIMKACTHEEFYMLIDRLGAETMLECCEHIPELVEKVKEVMDNPLVKSAALLSPMSIKDKVT
jgi:hypothetical protein